ncbi:lumenal Hsp70 protein [Puccinia graminis f. sp. tritici]|uniref:Lumenal Hsp70 protein n=1 Tax=Puccinia graminis f. sp. tritici TaxID=56615 RepID=A0A5B0S6F9_PUCGR|nr:lumenal Hsp70 protein [Puccinia graminis f. sp. tritici]
MRLLQWGLSLGLLSTSLFPTATARGILAIDYGTQFMKLSLVQPGIPFDVLLNHDSKRKTQAVVSVRGDDKLIGDDAAAMAARYPQNSYPGLKLLLGQPLDSPAYKLHQSLYNIPAESTTRGTIKLMPQLPPKGNTTLTYLPEELVALQFSYARELADAASANNPNAGVPGLGGEKITDCIITVPGFFNQFERKALLDGAELAGLKVLNLIDDGASFGVNYAMMRTFGNKKTGSKSTAAEGGPGIETHLIYDFGASSIKATVIEFSMFEEKIHVSSKTKKNVTMVDVKGYGHQRNMGGLVFDQKIRDLLKQDFLTQTKIDVSKNDRAMTKLLREATRVKQVLSANAESQSRIEGLVDEHDFKSTLTRQAFEDACVKEIPQFTQPILDALEHAKMSMADIKSVILVGGSSRVPMVQAAVKSLVGEDRIAVNVNADEAAVMGAALYGAGISRQFKTKDVRIHNVSPHAIAASYNVTKPLTQTDAASAEVAATKTITTTLFQTGSKLGAKKVIKMKKAEDFSVQLDYLNQPSYFPSSLLNVTIHGISAALLNYTNVTGHAVPLKNTTVKLVVGLDDSELVLVPEATLIFPTETSVANEGTIANKIAGFFGGSTKEEAEEAIEEVATEDDSSSKSESKEKGSSKGAQSEVEKAKEALKAENAGATDTASKKQQVENMTIKLTITRQSLGIQPMSTNDRIASGKFLRELKAAETRKRNREEARNALEAYTYKLRDRLEQQVFQSHSTEQETKDLKAARDEVSEWLNDWAEQAPLKELKEKKQKLERLEKPIQKRIVETKERPAAMERLNATLATAQSTQLLLKPIREDGGESAQDPMAKYTDEEIKGFAEMVKTQKEWFEETSLKVAQLEPNQDPPASVQDFEARLKLVQSEINKTLLKKAPKKRKNADQQPPYSAKPSPADSTINQTQQSHSQEQEPSSTSRPDDKASAEDLKPAEETHSKDEL